MVDSRYLQAHRRSVFSPLPLFSHTLLMHVPFHRHAHHNNTSRQQTPSDVAHRSLCLPSSHGRREGFGYHRQAARDWVWDRVGFCYICYAGYVSFFFCIFNRAGNSDLLESVSRIGQFGNVIPLYSNSIDVECLIVVHEPLHDEYVYPSHFPM